MCRSRRELSNAYLLAKIGVDTAENEPCKVCPLSVYRSPRYKRFEKRHKNMSVHCSPAFDTIKEGDIVQIGQCRPLAKTVRFNVIKVEAVTDANATASKKAFRVF